MKLSAIRNSLPALAIWALLLALSVANVLLLTQNLRLRAELNKHQPPEVLAAGERVAAAAALGLQGESINLDYPRAGPQRVLLFFSPDCGYSHAQFVYWREIIQRADPERFEVVGLARAAEDKARLEEYLRSLGHAAGSQHPLRVALISEETRRSYKLSITPMTVVVANDGRVAQVWRGRWDAATAATAETVFGLSFAQHARR